MSSEAAVSTLADGGGVARIMRERLRQIEAEGWTPEHDDALHRHGELAAAAAAYALGPERGRDHFPMSWPYKPTPGDRIRELAKAGALIAAEIDRLLRQPGATRNLFREVSDDGLRCLLDGLHIASNEGQGRGDTPTERALLAEAQRRGFPGDDVNFLIERLGR